MVQAITEIEDNENGERPVIVQFQNSKLQEGEESKLLTGIYKKSDEKTVVAIASKNILYTGEINKNDDDDLYNRFLLVSNRKTGKVRLIAVDTTTVTPQFAKKQPNVTDTPDNANNSINLLNKQFGSKKIKRITEQRERLKMNIDDVKEQLEQTVAGVEINTSESFAVEVSAENDSIYRPPINRDASTKEDVYNLDSIVPGNVLDSLEEEATSALSSESLKEFQLSPNIERELIKLQDSSSDDVLDKAKLLLYINYLIKYLAKPAKNITKKCIICQSSTEVNNHIMNNFSVLSNTGRSRPISMKDKTICYILVLSMIAFDYQIDIESMSKILKLGVKKIQEMGRILAFSYQGKDKNTMILKIPLPPAVTVTPKKRRK